MKLFLNFLFMKLLINLINYVHGYVQGFQAEEIFCFHYSKFVNKISNYQKGRNIW